MPEEFPSNDEAVVGGNIDGAPGGGDTSDRPIVPDRDNGAPDFVGSGGSGGSGAAGPPALPDAPPPDEDEPNAALPPDAGADAGAPSADDTSAEGETDP